MNSSKQFSSALVPVAVLLAVAVGAVSLLPSLAQAVWEVPHLFLLGLVVSYGVFAQKISTGGSGGGGGGDDGARAWNSRYLSDDPLVVVADNAASDDDDGGGAVRHSFSDDGEVTDWDDDDDDDEKADVQDEMAASPQRSYVDHDDYNGDGDELSELAAEVEDEVDRKADEFIAKFREQIRLQRL
uniref:DUF4408 domain-containing protein n=1 Tax=Oryza barthii TaxID=65489 RepID=A0A0D3F8E3_9ORYZ